MRDRVLLGAPWTAAATAAVCESHDLPFTPITLLAYAPSASMSHVHLVLLLRTATFANNRQTFVSGKRNVRLLAPKLEHSAFVVAAPGHLHGIHERPDAIICQACFTAHLTSPLLCVPCSVIALVFA
eukprot:6213172-Pleurochrysis_carterae.AAC.1